jgi:mono/diheme cytochrome c family protein
VLIAWGIVAIAGLALWIVIEPPAAVPDRSSARVAGEEAAEASQVVRGAYLARAGNCVACHTARGGALMAGGRPIDTPFGTLVTRNLTPHPGSGIGTWSDADFRRALHEGQAPGGRALYPACPYPQLTRVRASDADAIHAWLRSLPPVDAPHPGHRLQGVYGWPVALKLWRVLWFRPEPHRDDPARSEQWNRGAYLVRGLAHCSACHAPHNRWGAIDAGREFDGAPMISARWHAPSLSDPAQAGSRGLPVADVVALLRDGVASHGSALGPMAEVVLHGTSHLSDSDLRAMVVFLSDLPSTRGGAGPPAAPARTAEPRVLERGALVYREHCQDCHGREGEGAEGWPRLAGNRALTSPVAANVVRIVLSGGFPPSTPGNPRPYGMPPFSHRMSNAEVAAVVSYVRQAWGNQASPVDSGEVARWR